MNGNLNLSTPDNFFCFFYEKKLSYFINKANNMNVKVKISDSFKLETVLDELYRQDVKFPLPVGLKLYRIKTEISDLNSYVSTRLVKLMPNLEKNTNELSNDEIALYNSIVNSEVDIDNYGLTEEDINSCQDVHSNIENIGILSKIF